MIDLKTLVMSEVADGLFIGTFEEAATAHALGLLSICVHENPIVLHPADWWMPVLVNDRATVARLDGLADVIQWLHEGGMRVYLHCHHGVERSPLVAAWYLHRKHRMTLDAAYAQIMERRPMTQDRRHWIAA